jgi:hypothetical protein
MKVRAKRQGSYDHKRRRPGVVFDIKSEQEFSVLWMEKVENEAEDIPEHLYEPPSDHELIKKKDKEVDSFFKRKKKKSEPKAELVEDEVI